MRLDEITKSEADGCPVGISYSGVAPIGHKRKSIGHCAERGTCLPTSSICSGDCNGADSVVLRC